MGTSQKGTPRKQKNEERRKIVFKIMHLLCKYIIYLYIKIYLKYKHHKGTPGHAFLYNSIIGTGV